MIFSHLYVTCRWVPGKFYDNSYPIYLWYHLRLYYFILFYYFVLFSCIIFINGRISVSFFYMFAAQLFVSVYISLIFILNCIHFMIIILLKYHPQVSSAENYFFSSFLALSLLLSHSLSLTLCVWTLNKIFFILSKKKNRYVCT